MWLVVLIGCGLPIAAGGQTFTSLISFNGNDGLSPSFLAQNANGKLWVTIPFKGKSDCGRFSRVSSAGKLSRGLVIKCTDGDDPQQLILSNDGNSYGVLFGGGPGNGGSIFELAATGAKTVLYDFSSGGSSGSGPVGALALGSDGNFYGATTGGGNLSGYGTVFKITSNGVLTTLYQFDFTHGALPYAGLAEGMDGSFYGTTYAGGTYGQGTVYKITPPGDFKLLYSFGEYSTDPSSPVTSLILGTDGNFYGVTPYGGTNHNGTVYKITPSGTFTVLHRFAQSDGAFPVGLVQATDGNLYGTAGSGGANGYGAIFQITPAGNFATLHNFDLADGSFPNFIVQDTNGTLYGTTGGGGNLNCNPGYGCGTVYSLAVGLGPFIQTVPALGSVGIPVIILGTNLKKVTGVQFNGTAATYTVVSPSEIVTSVPAGAQSGTVTVTTKRGTISSNLPFTVTQ